MFGPVARELLAFGTVAFAVFGSVRHRALSVYRNLFMLNRALNYFPASRHSRRFRIRACVACIWLLSAVPFVC